MFILVLHDWCSSGNRFVKLKNDLTADGHRLTVMPFPGMGLEPKLWDRDILDHYAGSVASYVLHNDVECILAHGMGCTVAERALRLLCTTSKVWTGKLILVSPYYKGLKKLGGILRFGRWAPTLWKEMLGNSLLIYRWCRRYVSAAGAIDDLMFSDLRASQSDVALYTLWELVNDRSSVIPTLGRSFIICGSEDKLVRRRLIKEMSRNLNAEEVKWIDCGHYPMTECYGEFIRTIRRYLDA